MSGVDLNLYAEDVRRILYAKFVKPKGLPAGLLFEDAVSDIILRIQKANVRGQPYDPKRSSRSHYIYLQCSSYLMNYWKRSQRDPMNWQLHPIQDEDGKDVLFEIADPDSLIQINHLEGIKELLQDQLKQKGLAYRLVYNLLEDGHTVAGIVEATGKTKEIVRRIIREIIEEARLLVQHLAPAPAKARTTVVHEPTLRARFDGRVQKEECGCWRWTGTFCGDYGVLDVRDDSGKRRRIRACKLAIRLYYGERRARSHKPRHSCGNRWCVNPEHLGLPTEAPAEEKAVVVRLDQAAIQELALRRASGESEIELAAAYGVSVGTIQRVLEMTPWRKVA